VRALALAFALLRCAHCRCAAPRADKLPTTHGAPINLAKLYREVCTRGGYNNVRFERSLPLARPSLLLRSLPLRQRGSIARAAPPADAHAPSARAARTARQHTTRLLSNAPLFPLLRFRVCFRVPFSRAYDR
jgi:hypothetical protein